MSDFLSVCVCVRVCEGVCVCKSAMLSFACHTVMQTVRGPFRGQGKRTLKQEAAWPQTL